MAIFTGAILSGSTNGKPIPVAATSTPGTTIHTAGSSGFDEVFLFAANVTGSAVAITLEWGGTSDPSDLLVKSYSIPANSPPVPLALGQRLSGGLVIKAFAGTASALNITGWVNQVR